jgi:hypothetical protein
MVGDVWHPALFRLILAILLSPPLRTDRYRLFVGFLDRSSPVLETFNVYPVIFHVSCRVVLLSRVEVDREEAGSLRVTNE